MLPSQSIETWVKCSSVRLVILLPGGTGGGRLQAGRGFKSRRRAPGAEPRDELPIGRREVELAEPVGRDPRHGLRLPRLDRPRLEPAPEEVQDHGSVRILPPDRGELLADREARRELFRQLPLEAGLGRLPNLLLAARELPEPFEVRSPPALGDQVATRRVPDERRCDLDHERHGAPRTLREATVAQKPFIGQEGHFGFRGVHHVAPKSMSAWLKSYARPRGTRTSARSQNARSPRTRASRRGPTKTRPRTRRTLVSSTAASLP